jgi:hypothetical protein
VALPIQVKDLIKIRLSNNELDSFIVGLISIKQIEHLLNIIGAKINDKNMILMATALHDYYNDQDEDDHSVKIDYLLDNKIDYGFELN